MSEMPITKCKAVWIQGNFRLEYYPLINRVALCIAMLGAKFVDVDVDWLIAEFGQPMWV